MMAASDPQRGKADLGALVRNLRTILPDFCADAFQELGRAAHHASAQNDHFRAEDTYQVGKAQPEILRLALDSFPGENIAISGHGANLFCSQARLAIFSHPRGHSRARRQDLPAAARAAIALWAAGVDYLVTNFRVRAVDAAV